MTPAELCTRLVDLLGGNVTCTTSYDETTVDIHREQWVPSVVAVRDGLDLTFFDLLTGVDEQARGFDVVLRLWAPLHRYGLLLRTRCPRDDARLPSLCEVFAGAAWHEREVSEMFGIVFTGHPALTPLLLPEGFDGHPMRKEFLLPARQDKPWPGAKDPGESDADLVGGRPRRRNLPPGVAPPGRRP